MEIKLILWLFLYFGNGGHCSYQRIEIVELVDGPRAEFKIYAHADSSLSSKMLLIDLVEVKIKNAEFRPKRHDFDVYLCYSTTTRRYYQLLLKRSLAEKTGLYLSLCELIPVGNKLRCGGDSMILSSSKPFNCSL